MSVSQANENDFFPWYSFVKASARKGIFNKRFLLVILVMLFLSGVMGYAAIQEPHGLNEGSNFLDLLVISFFLPLITMIFGSSFFNDEVEDKSITHVLISPLSRTKIYLGYTISLIIVSVIAMLMILTSGFFAYFSIVGLDSEALELFLNMGSLIIIGSIVYPTLFILVSILLEKSLYFGLFYVFIWEGFVGSLPGKIKLISIRHYVRSIGSELIDYGTIAGYSEASDIWPSVQALSILVTILIVIGIIIFRRKEFP